MRSIITIITVLAFAVVSSGCPKSDDKSDKNDKSNAKKPTATKSPPPAKTETSGKTKSTEIPGLVEAKSLLEQSKLIATNVLGKGKDVSTASLDEVKQLGTKIAATSKDGAIAAASKVNTLVRSLATNPDAKLSSGQRIARMMVLMVPLVGPTKRFIDARAAYESGLKNKDEKRIQHARRETLMAFVEAGLDIGTLGLVGSKIDLVATGFNKVLGLLSVSRKVSALLGSDLKTFDLFLDKLLTNDEIKKAVDGALASGAQ